MLGKAGGGGRWGGRGGGRRQTWGRTTSPQGLFSRLHHQVPNPTVFWIALSKPAVPSRSFPAGVVFELVLVASSLQPPATSPCDLHPLLFLFLMLVFLPPLSPFFQKPGAVCEMLNERCGSRLSSISCAACFYINLSKHKHSNTAVLILHKEYILSLKKKRTQGEYSEPTQAAFRLLCK